MELDLYRHERNMTKSQLELYVCVLGNNCNIKLSRCIAS